MGSEIVTNFIRSLRAAIFVCASFAVAINPVLAVKGSASSLPVAPFAVEEASIAEIQAAILSHRVTTEDVPRLYLNRILAYNGTCVSEPNGLLGPIESIADAGQVNAQGQPAPMTPSPDDNCENQSFRVLLKSA
ncbi:MAG: amidase [Sphingomonadales bacterium]|nr:amidase [Sphingomonadales bacterium]